MSAKLKLTLACGDYEIVKALKDGSIAPDGIELNVLTDMDSSSRTFGVVIPNGKGSRTGFLGYPRIPA